ncbi:MAG: hypothetical protein RL701_5409 [Pseudomonadota bacterium]
MLCRTNGRGLLARAFAVCALLSCACLRLSSARADDTAIVPPKLLELPQLTLPEGVAAPDAGLVTVVVLVREDGHAQVESCDSGPQLCELASAALDQARFEPARRGDTAIAVRVRVALRVAELQTAEVPAADSGAELAADGGEAAPDAGVADAAVEPDDVYGARARTQQIKQAGMRRLELAEVRDMPGSFGDPFRGVDVMPGVVPFMLGLPYFYLRGAPPSGTLYFYDGVPMPTLYHMGLGAAVIHPRMVGPIRLYSGVAPARYGRFTGGVVVGEGPESSADKTRAEAELRLLDVSGFVQTDVAGGTLSVAGRYGYPGLLLSLISSQFSLAYWDYELRYSYPLSDHDRFELVALGSYDTLKQAKAPEDDILITYHRLEPRYIRRGDDSELGVALTLGWEKSGLGRDFRLQLGRLAPRAWFEQRFAGRSRLRVSADAQGTIGGPIGKSSTEFIAETLSVLQVGKGRRGVLGAQVELNLRPWTALEIELGARVDAWLRATGNRAAFDPRARVILHLSDAIDVHVAAGLAHQPAVPFITLPGLTEYASAPNLQTALQTEAGVGWDLPFATRLELQGFVHRYRGIIFGDAAMARESVTGACFRSTGVDGPCGGANTPSRISGTSYGAELFVRRPLGARLSGMLSYTLAWMKVGAVAGMPYTPSWDVRHVANLVLQWQVSDHFTAGLRGFVRSGKMGTSYYHAADDQVRRYQRRLPGFVRVDLELAYAWRTSWGRMRASLEWFNVTLSSEPNLECFNGPPGECSVYSGPPIFVPNIGLRAEY